MKHRCNRETALRLLAASGTNVTLSEPDLTEDADGLPLGVELVEVGTGMLYVTPELLGWSAAELGLDDDEDAAL